MLTVGPRPRQSYNWTTVGMTVKMMAVKVVVLTKM